MVEMCRTREGGHYLRRPAEREPSQASPQHPVRGNPVRATVGDERTWTSDPLPLRPGIQRPYESCYIQTNVQGLSGRDPAHSVVVADCTNPANGTLPGAVAAPATHTTLTFFRSWVSSIANPSSRSNPHSTATQAMGIRAVNLYCSKCTKNKYHRAHPISRIAHTSPPIARVS